ncbi:uncharacterized protein KQ657_003294 [Scheffersomyces spartinae]|uniref:t-SNARE affecting a late Golgi compartment protein 1 n=1 Tax=Scheffersomyces spartinae TaxID=45513 RepID=A0A9P7VCN7_9ASCO|nr:uncharacterized protein KQ657_003294 [Scheffersomyces spartinae]KAG7195531.1 hypothetical protein KQ657_003294 [Scheffersomyces spartinae]
MDPFNDVRDDAKHTIDRIEKILLRASNDITEEIEQEYENNFLELQEICDDLSQALLSIEHDPSRYGISMNEINRRKQEVLSIQERTLEIKNKWQSLNQQSNSRQHTQQQPAGNALLGNRKLREVTTMSNRISQEGYAVGENPFDDSNRFHEGKAAEAMDSFQSQQVMQEQDLQLDSIHQTMMSLNQQAMIMGDELEDQGQMLDDLDGDLDLTGNRLQRGMKRIEIVIEKNKEWFSDICIILLVVALVILLLMLIVV